MRKKSRMTRSFWPAHMEGEAFIEILKTKGTVDNMLTRLKVQFGAC